MPIVVGVAAAWTAAVVVTSLVRPGLEDTRLVARVHAFASLLVQTFRFHAGVAALVLAVIFAFRRRRWPAVAIAAMGAVGIAPEVRHAWPAHGAAASDGQPVRLMSFNNHTERRNADAILATIRAERPDLIAFQELTDVVDDRLAAGIGHAYTFRMTFPFPTGKPRGPGSAGIGLYSRWPLEPREWVGSPLDGRLFAADVTIAGRIVRVFPVHFRTPQSVALVAANRRQVAHCLRRIAEWDGPTIVAGDCNWPIGAEMTDRFRGAGLAHVDDRAGAGPRWTWMPKRTLPITRIDHAFASREFGVVDSRVLPTVGSDHRPIFVDLRLR